MVGVTASCSLGEVFIERFTFVNVRSRAARAAVLVVAGLALASCSDVHPGSAAVVDGESISMKTIDDASVAYCQLALAVAAQQGVEAISKADTRRQSVADLINLEVARKVVNDRDLEIDSKSFAITEEQRGQILQAFPKGDRKEITAAIARSQETYTIIIALGEAATGDKATEENIPEIEAAGQQEIAKAVKSADVEIDPRFGLDDTTKQVASSGSLSVPAVAEDADPAKLPASQRCS